MTPELPAVDRRPTHEELHRDIGLANQFRLEFIKHALSLTAAVFVFTVTFVKDIVGDLKDARGTEMILIGWLALAISLLGGLGHLVGWDRYYISYRDDADDYQRGQRNRKQISLVRRVAMFFQLAGFGIGLVMVALFAYVNLVARTAQ